MKGVPDSAFADEGAGAWENGCVGAWEHGGMGERAPNAIEAGERGRLGVRAVRLDLSVEERSAQTFI